MVKRCCVATCNVKFFKGQRKFFRVPFRNRQLGSEKLRRWESRSAVWLSRIFKNALPDPENPTIKVKELWICEDHFLQGRPSPLADTDNPDWAPSQKLDNPLLSVQAKQKLEEMERRTLPGNDQGNDAEVHEDRDCGVLETADFVEAGEKPEENNVSEESVQGGDSDTFFVCGMRITDKAASTQTIRWPTIDVGVQTKEKKLTRSIAVQTDLLSSDIDKLEKRVDSLEVNEGLLRDDPNAVKFFTAMPSFEVLMLTYKFVANYIPYTKRSVLTPFQQFILTMMKLRLNLFFTDLGYRFGVCRQTASRVFFSVIGVMYGRLQRNIFWPSRDTLKQNMPQSFQDAFGKSVTVIIDCFEIFIEKPSNLRALGETYSSYKSHQTLKYLIGITPQGFVCHISDGFGGKCSDKFATEKGAFLEHLEPGDTIMADRGFLIKDMVDFYLAKVILPGFKKDLEQMSPLEIERTRKIANVRVHVERVIGCLRQKFTILSNTVPITILTNNSVGFDEVVFVCCCLLNMCPSVVPLI